MLETTQKNFLTTKGIKIQGKNWMKSQISSMDYKIQMMKPNMDENNIKIA
jgi:hypothetical protein